MKKIFSILAIACIAMLFAACHKDGVYNPSKKISKIYHTDYSGVKSLSQVWTWNKDNTLEKIDFYSYGSVSYTYNFTYEKKRLVRMNNYANNRYVEYKYDGNKLKEANYYSSGTLVDTYTFTYKNGKISTVTDTYISSKGEDNMRINPLQFILPEEMCMIAEKSAAKHISKDNGKSTSTYTYELTWDKNNVSKLVMNYGSESETLEAQYDKYNNPYYGAMLNFYMEDNLSAGYLSQNNITRVEYTEQEDGEVEMGTWSYEYTYEGKYPVTRRFIEDDYTTLTEYEYTK